MRFNKGFTLIEILIVVAIIGILSAIVMASLGSAKGKGNDVAIQSNLANIRAQSELYYSFVGNYGSGTPSPSPSYSQCANVSGSVIGSSTLGFANALKAVVKLNGGTTLGTDPYVACSNMGTPMSNWAIIASTSKPTVNWCVDSSGQSKSEPSTSVGISNAKCI